MLKKLPDQAWNLTNEKVMSINLDLAQKIPYTALVACNVLCLCLITLLNIATYRYKQSIFFLFSNLRMFAANEKVFELFSNRSCFDSKI